MGASGNVNLDFGAWPGSPSATVDVTGQTGFTVASQVEAWVQPEDTADHTADEHRAEDIKVFGVWQVDGTIRITGEWKPEVGNVNGHAMPYGLFQVGWVWV